MKMCKYYLLMLGLFITVSTHAKVIELRVSDYGWLNAFPVLKPILDAYVQTQEDKLNQIQPIKDPSRFAKGVANSTAIASRGLGTDYSSRMRNFFVGISIGAAADLERNVALKDLESGLGGAASVVFGKVINKRLNVYGNIGGVNHSQTFQGILGTDLEGEITTFNTGLHVRYDLIPGSEDWHSGWGGVKTHFGLEYNHNEITFTDRLNEDLNLDVGGVATVQGRLKGTPQYTIETNIVSLPMEFSTDYRFWHIFSVFGGLGADLNMGTAKSKADAKATLFSPLTCSSGICTNLNLPEIEAKGNLNAEEKVNAFTGRAFGGMQLSFGQLSGYGMVNQVIGTKVLGVTLGGRLVF